MKRRLDTLTGSVTMYRFVLLTLGAIAVIALALSLFGVLSFNPLDMLLTALVACAITLGSSTLLALLFRTRPHTESSLITSALLFFLFTPGPQSLGGIAIAAVAASLSKYLLSIRGRHLLNPAAFGAIVAGVTGVDYAVWWMATPSLFIPVLIGAFLVLYRTRRLPIGAVFSAVAVAIYSGRTVAAGGELMPALATSMLSVPIVFLAGFMLSEPLTLPPRRWQQLLVAALVGVLFATPYSLPPLYSSPEIALVVGNVMAFLFGQRRTIRMRYLGKKELAQATWELSFQPSHPVHFRPGQYMELTLPHRQTDFRGSRRYFTIASAPTSGGPLSFAITVPPTASSFKRTLLDLEPGAEIHGTGVGGDFVLPRDLSQPLLLLAGGIGITPFASQLAHAHQRGEVRDITIVYAVSSTELPYLELLERTGARVIVFAPEAPSLPPSWVYGGKRVTAESLAAMVPDAPRRLAFVSGPPALVYDLTRTLRGQGVRRIRTDYFSGY